MKNTLKYYYDIDLKEYRKIDDNYLFDDYYFIRYYKNINAFIYNYLIENNYKVHQIIYNKDNEYITYVDNIPYVLLKLCSTDDINLDFLMKYNIILETQHNNWADLWSKKIDLYEKNIDNVKNDKIKKCFNYYAGVCENAISLFKTLDLSNEKTYLSHIRFNNELDFYNPINLMTDYKMRDIAEYIKSKCYQNKYKEMINYIKKIEPLLSYKDSMLLFIRLMYPTCYFDNYDNYMKEDNIDYTFVDHISSYEQFLKQVYKIISIYYRIPQIEWLI